MTTRPVMAASRAVTVGVDLGGTGTRVVALDLEGVVQAENTLATAPAGTPASVAVKALIDQIILVVGTAELAGVGIGASGPVDPGGVIRNDDTLPVFSHIDLVGLMTQQLGVRCVVDNDAATAAVGENLYGAGKGSSALLMVTLGTGVGVAVVSQGIPFRALDGSHPEAGHIAVPGPAAPCYCGLSTCWEQLASRTALDAMTSGRSQEIARRAEARDPEALLIFRNYGQRVGIGLGNLLTVFRPERVVLGGGAARYLHLFAGGMDEAVTRVAPFAWTPPVTEASLGSLSGAIGAAVLARSLIGRR